MLGKFYVSIKVSRMVNRVDRDTTLCISLAARPSNHGVRFHNYLYDKLGLNFLYKAVAPEDLTAAVAGIRGLGIRGAGVSMPFKQEVISLLDQLDPSAERINAVNTIVNTAGELKGYNTDYLAIESLLRSHEVSPQLPVAVRGSGGMAAAVVSALAAHGMSGTVVARNHTTGAPLAATYGWDYSATVPEEAAMLVNVTPLGMRGAEENELAFPEESIENATVVFDCVADPVRTPLVRRAEAVGLGSTPGTALITGGEVIALQAARQFELYTGVELTVEQVMEAEEFASA